MIKKFAAAVGLIGGVAAVVWAMRDRFISVAVSREPEPPSFRGSKPGRVDQVEGIGPVFAARLSEAGIDSLASLANSDPEKVAGAAKVSPQRARAWIEQAGSVS